MAPPFYIAPSILASDFSALGSQISEAEAAGADWIHIDVMDGHFVPNITMGPDIVKACRRVTNRFLDVHLMVENPDLLLQKFQKAGADMLTVHVEASPHLHRTLQEIKRLGCKCGVALNPATPANLVRPVLQMVDLVLVMSVNPGFGGQVFLPEVLPKAIQLRHWLDEINSSAVIEMDGGISEETIGAARDSGVQVFVAGSSVFRNPQGIKTGVHVLRDQLG